MTQHSQVSVMFVCMGNICRSPTAHGVFRHLVHRAGLTDRIQISSSGTHAYHVGHPPDHRSMEAARRRGIDISDLRAQQIRADDFEQYDYILVMDHANHELIMQACPETMQHKVRYFLEFAPQYKVIEVPDPYYGSGNGFERVLDMVEDASKGLLYTLKKELLRAEASA